MNWLFSFLKSSIGKKLLMALTGLFLSLFLVIHLIGNFQLFYNDSGLAFNSYAATMTTNPLIKIASYGTYLLILLHVIRGLLLVFENKKARPVEYHQTDSSSNSSWASRNMGLLGTVILLFLIFHMSGFWGKYKFGHVPYTQYVVNTLNDSAIQVVNNIDTNKMIKSQLKSKLTVIPNGEYKIIIAKDLYYVVKDAFKQPWISFIYILSMIALGFHLVHGFSSAFQSLGLNNSKFNPVIKFIGTFVFGFLIPLLFAAIPFYFLINF